VEVIPAIDLLGGSCVRLFQGDYSQKTIFSDDPVSTALSWRETGVPRIHVVDLDGAREGLQVNLSVIKEIVQAVPLPVQVGGGIRSLDTIQRLLQLGVSRVVLGTVAVENPELVYQACRNFGSERIVVGLDALGGVLRVRGWLETSSATVVDMVRQMEGMGVGRFVYTDISRDGTLTRPNFEAVSELMRNTPVKVIASGGVASLEDLICLSTLGVEGTIVGRAIYQGQLDLREAILAVPKGSE
jgi:phosphoribosylformimino-5-aminoimidazole carboxamide ribotide isomerase